MRRRTLLKMVTGWLGGVCAAVVGVPGIGFLLDALRRNESNGEIVRRVARIKDLPVGKPVAIPIVGSRQDAWTVHPDEVLGRVWLVRQSEKQDSDQSVVALTATCPHLGCMIQHDSKENRFQCPCHRAIFGITGEKITDGRSKQNHAPRAMDSLPCRLVTDEESHDVWVEVTYQKFEQGLTKKVCKA